MFLSNSSFFLQTGFITVDDIRRGLSLVGDLNPQELNITQSLIFESAVTSVVFADGTRGMQLVVGDGEVPFIRRIVDILVEKMHSSGTFFPSVQDFVHDCENHQFLPAQFFATLRHQTANTVRVLQQQQYQLQQLQQLQQQKQLELHQLELQHQHQQALAQQQQLQLQRQAFTNNQAKSTPQQNYATAPHNPSLLGNHVVVNNSNPLPTPPTGTTRLSQRSSSLGSYPGSLPSSQSISTSNGTGTSSTIVSRANTPPDSPPEDTAGSVPGAAAGSTTDPSQDITTLVNGNGIVIIVPKDIVPPKDDFETSEIGTRFLAEIRRGGMDILFPPKKHDHVLVIIFAVFRLMGSTAHKELIDLIMNMKESGTVPHLDNISKTKVRGVIALLKLAAIIETHGGTTEKVPVNLTLSPHIECFETLREQHDEYIRAFGQCLPDLWQKEANWSKLVWGKSLIRWTNRLEEVESFIPNLLKSPPMLPLVDAAGETRVGEIFVTREQAYKSTSIYRSFSFDFGSTDDESASLYPVGMVQVYADEDDDDGDGNLTTARDGSKGALRLSGLDETEELLMDAMVGAGNGPPILSPPSSSSKSEGTENESTDSFPDSQEFFNRTTRRYTDDGVTLTNHGVLLLHIV